MNKNLKILLLEDLQSDAELIIRQLKKGNIACETLVVSDKESFVVALTEFSPDLILSDHTLPAFNSLEALKILLERKIKVPFILCTGTMSEEFAAKVMKEGAWDYVQKDQLDRLPEAVNNAMAKFQHDRQRQKFLYDSILNEAYMEEAERIAHYGSWEIDMVNGKFKLSKEAHSILGYSAGETETSHENIFNKVHIDEIPHLKYVIANIKSDPILKTYKDTFRLIDKNGELQFIKTEFVIKHNKKYELLRINGFIQDVTADKLKLAVNNEISVQSTCSDKQAVIILDANGFVLGSNLEVLDILGYTQEELIDMSISKIYEHPEFLTDELDLYSKKIKETSRFENDGYYLKKDGSKFQANVVVTTLLTRHGSIYGFMMVIRSRI